MTGTRKCQLNMQVSKENCYVWLAENNSGPQLIQNNEHKYRKSLTDSVHVTIVSGNSDAYLEVRVDASLQFRLLRPLSVFRVDYGQNIESDIE